MNFDINETLKQKLRPLLKSDWKLQHLNDLKDDFEQYSKDESLPRQTIEDASELIWKGVALNNFVFIFEDSSLTTRIYFQEASFKIPQETFGTLRVCYYGCEIFTITWHGYEFILVDNIKIELRNCYPFPHQETALISKILKIFSDS